MKSIADKMKASVLSSDKFVAATQAMSNGTLNQQKNSRNELEPALSERSVTRENFSFPLADSALIDTLRKRAATRGVLLNRSEILRSGLAALNALSDDEIAAVGTSIPKMRAGRPPSRSS